MNTDRAAQIEALLGDSALAWAVEKLGLPKELLTMGSWESHDRCVKACMPAFTVSRKEIDEYVRQRGFGPKTWYWLVPSNRDGMYFIEEDGRFHFYYQERGNAQWHVSFPSVEEAMPFIINDRINEKRFPHLMAPTTYAWHDHDG